MMFKANLVMMLLKRVTRKKDQRTRKVSIIQAITAKEEIVQAQVEVTLVIQVEAPVTTVTVILIIVKVSRNQTLNLIICKVQIKRLAKL